MILALPMTQDELERELAELPVMVCAAVRGEPRQAHEVGARLVELGCSSDEALPCTVDVLGRGLLALPEFQPVNRFTEPTVLGLSPKRTLTSENRESAGEPGSIDGRWMQLGAVQRVLVFQFCSTPTGVKRT